MTPASTAASRRTLSRLTAVLRDAVPDRRAAVFGSLAWSVANSIGAVAGVLANGWQTPERLAGIGVMFGLGALLAFTPALTLANLLSRRRSRQAAFAASFLSLALVTAAVTAVLFGLHLRLYFADTHSDPFSLSWAVHLAFHMITSALQFAVLGSRLYFPFGFAALFAASLWHARRAR